MKILGREPAVIIGLIGAALTVLGTLNIPILSGEQSVLWTALIGAVTGVLVAWKTKPVAPGVVLAVVATVVPLVASYGLHIGDETVSAVNGLVLALVALQARAQVTPEDDPRPDAVV